MKQVSRSAALCTAGDHESSAFGSPDKSQCFRARVAITGPHGQALNRWWHSITSGSVGLVASTSLVLDARWDDTSGRECGLPEIVIVPKRSMLSGGVVGRYRNGGLVMVVRTAAYGDPCTPLRQYGNRRNAGICAVHTQREVRGQLQVAVSEDIVGAP